MQFTQNRVLLSVFVPVLCVRQVFQFVKYLDSRKHFFLTTFLFSIQSNLNHFLVKYQTPAIIINVTCCLEFKCLCVRVVTRDYNEKQINFFGSAVKLAKKESKSRGRQKMEFPYLGKHCSEKSCNKLGMYLNNWFSIVVVGRTRVEYCMYVMSIDFRVTN